MVTLMAQRYLVQLTDDITGEAIEDGAGESVRFALDGAAYTIDLSDKNSAQLREVFAPYVAAARKVQAQHTTPRGSRGSTGPKKDLAAIREWANARGEKVSSRGRIPSSIIEAYEAAH
jgi:hypothetical protein